MTKTRDARYSGSSRVETLGVLTLQRYARDRVRLIAVNLSRTAGTLGRNVSPGR